MILPIFEYGDPILRAKGERIEKIDNQVRELAANMIETMRAAHGVGLAAQQVGGPQEDEVGNDEQDQRNDEVAFATAQDGPAQRFGGFGGGFVHNRDSIIAHLATVTKVLHGNN